MAFTAKITESIDIAGLQTSLTQSYTNSAQVAIDEAVLDSTTDHPILVTLDVSALSAIYVVADQIVDFQWENATTGTPEWLARPANQPYVWHSNSLLVNLLTVDIVTLYVTNASGSTANVKIRALYDSTP